MMLTRFANWQIRVGTKIVIINWIITSALLVWLIFIIPALALKFQGAREVLKLINISTLITALIGQAGVLTAVNEIRKTFETKWNGNGGDMRKEN